MISGLNLRIGSKQFASSGMSLAKEENATSVWCSVMREDGESQDAVLFIFEDQVRPEAKEVITRLASNGIMRR